MLIMLDITAEIKSFAARHGKSIKEIVLALNKKGLITTGYNNILNKINCGSITFNEAQYIFDHLGYKITIERK